MSDRIEASADSELAPRIPTAHLHDGGSVGLADTP
jgi:hypothetical protein